ncbi:DUF2179 domain-containing protein [Bacillota bacterium]
MDFLTQFSDNVYFAWIVLPLLIFFSRIIDVTMGTLRIIFVSRGKKAIAPFLGFFEVFIWLVVITNIMSNANNIACYIAYAAGFATGNLVGIMLEEKLAIGILSVRIFVPDDKIEALSNALTEKGYGMTIVRGSGKLSDTNILDCIIRRKEYDSIVATINDIDRNLFYFADELKHVRNGIFLNSDVKK